MTPAAWLLPAPVVWGMYTWGSYLPLFARRRRGSGRERKVALTFDDGPDPEHTPKVLDVLARENVKGTFFLIGQRAAAAPAVVRRIAEEGHDIGNHTWSHRGFWLCGPRETERQIGRAHEAISAAAGRPPRFFRPPWGLTNLAMFGALRRYGTPCVLWTVQPEGARRVDPDRQRQRTMDRVGPGAIVDLHDADGVPGAGGRLVRALPGLIESLRGAGYSMVPLRELP